MYKIYADDTLIYDSTIEDLKIGKGSVSLEVGKSGSFTFSLYPDHPFYDAFVKLKTVITVYRRGRIVFRGRILNDVTDYWNNKVITCEGELGFLQDSIIRPFVFQGSPEDFFKKMIDEHNAQVDEFKKFKVGSVTIVDSNDYIYRSSSLYEPTLKSMTSRLPESGLGGYFYITHGEDGRDPIPTINYVADFIKISAQTIEFGLNLTKYTKTVKSEDIATAIIPLGATVDDGNAETEDKRVNIAEVNDGIDYVYSESGVALYGWIFKVVEWNDVTLAKNLKTKAEAYLEDIVKQNITIELSAVDLNLLDETIESLNVCEYIRVLSTPHNFDAVLLCNKQTIDLLNPSKDSYVLGHNYSTFTENSNKIAPAVTKIIDQNYGNVDHKIKVVGNKVVNIEQNIYYPDTTQIDGGKIRENSVTSEQVDYEDIFAANIDMSGRFLSTKSAFLEPGIEELNEIYELMTTGGYSELYDFDADGRITPADFLTAREAMLRNSSLAGWSKAENSEVSIEIDMSDPDNAIRLYGTNMWGHYVEKSFGINTPFAGSDIEAEFNELVKRDAYIVELEARIKALEDAKTN
jgi:hypothetical protein